MGLHQRIAEIRYSLILLNIDRHEKDKIIISNGDYTPIRVIIKL